VGILSDLYSGSGGGITQQAYNERFTLPVIAPDYSEPEADPFANYVEPSGDLTAANYQAFEDSGSGYSDLNNYRNYGEVVLGGDDPFANFGAPEDAYNRGAQDAGIDWASYGEAFVPDEEDTEFGNFGFPDDAYNRGVPEPPPFSNDDTNWAELTQHTRSALPSDQENWSWAESAERFRDDGSISNDLIDMRAETRFAEDPDQIVNDLAKDWGFDPQRFTDVGDSNYGTAEPEADPFANFDAGAAENLGVTRPLPEPEFTDEFGATSAAYKEGPQATLMSRWGLDTTHLDSQLPEEFRDEFNSSLIDRNNWTPDQAREQLDSLGTPTFKSAFDLAAAERSTWERDKAIFEGQKQHEELTPDFGSLEEAQAVVRDRGFYTSDEVDAMPDEEVYRRARQYMNVQDISRRQEEGELGGGSLGGLFGAIGSIPGQAVKGVLDELPEEFSVSGGIAGRDLTIQNPLANDVVAEMAGGLANIGAGAILFGPVGAFAGGMAPAFVRDPDTGVSAWDEMSWEEKAFLTGTSIANAGLLTKGLALERLLGGETLLGQTAAGVGINAITPVLSGFAQVALTDQDMNDKEFWVEVAKQAAIWGTVRGAFGVVPVAREQFSTTEIPDFSQFRGMTPDGPEFGGTVRATQGELRGFTEGMRWLGEEAENARNIDEMPANLILIPKLADEMRGNGPFVALDALQDLSRSNPETVGTMALAVRMADELGDTVKPIAARQAGGSGLLPTSGGGGLTALQGVLDSALTHIPPERTRKFQGLSEPPTQVVVDTSTRAPFENHPFDLGWTGDDGQIHINPRAALGEAAIIKQFAPDATESLAEIAGAIAHASVLFEYGRSRSITPLAGEDVTYNVDFVQQVLQSIVPEQVAAATTEFQRLIDSGMAPAPARLNALRAPQNFSIEAPDNAVIARNTHIGGAREAFGDKPYSAPLMAAFTKGLNALRELPAVKTAGINQKVAFGGFTANDLMGEFKPVGDKFGGTDGTVYLNPADIAKALDRYDNLRSEDLPIAYAQVATHTLIHELAHSVEAPDATMYHVEAFNRALAIATSLGSEGIRQVAKTMEADLAAIPADTFRAIFRDATQRRQGTGFGTNASLLDSNQRGVREPLRGDSTEVLQPGDGALLPATGDSGGDATGRTGEPLRGDSPDGEPAGSPVRRADGPDGGAADQGLRTTHRDGQLQRASDEAEDAGLDQDTLYKPKRREKSKFKQETKYPHNRSEGMTRRNNKGSQYQSGRSSSEEGKARGWDTLNAEDGAARAQYAASLSGMVAGGAYGWSQGDSQEEKLYMAAGGAFLGLLAGSTFGGGLAWYAKRKAMGKAIELPEPEKSFTYKMKPHEVDTLRKELGTFASDMNDMDLELQVHVMGLNKLAAENQRTIIEGLKAPYEGMVQSLEALFGSPKAGSEAELLKNGQMAIIGHWDHLKDVATRAMNDMYKLAEKELKTPEDRARFILAFEQPVKYGGYFKRNPEVGVVALAMSQAFNKWGQMLAERGMLAPENIQDPRSWRDHEKNYVTHVYENFSENDKLYVMNGNRPSYSKTQVEMARNYKTLGDAIYGAGKVMQDVNPVALAIRYFDVVGNRIVGYDLQRMVSELAENPEHIFISEATFNKLSESQQTVMKLGDYEKIDSPLFRNRVDPLDIAQVHDHVAAIKKVDRDLNRWLRLAGYHGKKAVEAENRAFTAAKHLESLEKQVLDRSLTLEKRVEARDEIVTWLNSEARTTLDEVRKLAEAKGRAGLASSEASLRFGRTQQRLQNALQMLDDAAEMTPESIDADAIALSNAKDELVQAMEQGRETLAEERDAEVSNLIEDASDLFNLKEKKKETARLAKEAEEAAITKFKAEWQADKKTNQADMAINATEQQIAFIEGRMRENERLIGKELKKAIGSDKTPGHEERLAEYEAWAEQAKLERDALTDALTPLKERMARDRGPLLVRKDVAPLFRWTEKSGLRHGSVAFGVGNMGHLMNAYGRWVETLLSGPFDLYLMNVHAFTNIGNAVFSGHQGEAVNIALTAYQQAFNAAFSPHGNAKWFNENEPWMHFFRTKGIGFSQRSAGEFYNDPTKSQSSTLLGWIPAYEGMVGMMNRAQFEGATTVYKLENARLWFFEEMNKLMKEHGIDPDQHKGWVVEALEAKGFLVKDGKVEGLHQPRPKDMFDAYMEALLKTGISQIEIDRAGIKAAKIVDSAYGGRNMKFSGLSSTKQDALRLLLLAPNWFITRLAQFGSAVWQTGMTPVQLGENVVQAAFNTGAELAGTGARYQRKTPHPFDMHSQPGKQWAMGTIATGTASLVMAAIGMSMFTESKKKGELSGPNWRYVYDAMHDAFTDPTHLFEIRDPWSGQYWTPFTWQKDILRVAIASYYVARPIIEEGRPPTEEDYAKAWETVASYGKARLGPMGRTIMNFLLNKNFAGKDISDGGGSVEWAKDQFINFLKENQPQAFTETEKALPIPGQDGKTLGELMGQGYTNPLFALFNVLGIGRGRTQTPLDKAFVADQRATKEDGSPLYPELQGATNYSTLGDPNAKSEFLNRHPDVKDYLRGGLPEGYREVADAVKKDITALAAQAEAGERNGEIYFFAKFREDIKIKLAEARGASGTLGFEDKEGDSDKERLLNSYYRLYDDATVNGVLDGELFNTKFATWAEGKGEDEINYVFKASQIGDPKILQEYARAIIELKRLDAFDMPRYDPAKLKSGRTEEELLDYIARTKQEMIQSGAKEFGGSAIVQRLYEQNGVTKNSRGNYNPGSIPQDLLEFGQDIKHVMGDPSNQEYIDLKKEHAGLFAWLRQDVTYDSIVSLMENEPDDVFDRIFNVDD
jgi:hypothetical protein